MKYKDVKIGGLILTLYTVADVARMKGCSPRTVRSAVARGALTARRAGPRLWLIDPKSAAQWQPRTYQSRK